MDFTSYLSTKLIPALRKKVVNPRLQNGTLPLNRTNNNCEAMNHILKMETNWKAEKVPELVESIHRLVQLQFADVRRALHGQGNYQLASHVRQYEVVHVNWTTKTAEEREKLFNDFMSYKPRKRPDGF